MIPHAVGVAVVTLVQLTELERHAVRAEVETVLAVWVRKGLIPSYRIGRCFARVAWEDVLDAVRRQAPSVSQRGG